MTPPTMPEVIAEIDRLADDNAQLRAAITRIQDLHHIGAYWDWDGNYGPYTGCIHCRMPWPCPTITAIGKTP